MQITRFLLGIAVAAIALPAAALECLHGGREGIAFLPLCLRLRVSRVLAIVLVLIGHLCLLGMMPEPARAQPGSNAAGGRFRLT